MEADVCVMPKVGDVGTACVRVGGWVCVCVCVCFCGNMFIGSNLRITCINDIIGYLSYPFDLLNLI